MVVIPQHFKELARAIENLHEGAAAEQALRALPEGVIKGDARMVHYALEAVARARTPEEASQGQFIVMRLLRAGASVGGVDGPYSQPLLYRAIDLKLPMLCMTILETRPEALQVHEADREVDNPDGWLRRKKLYKAPHNPLHYAISTFGPTEDVQGMLSMLEVLMHRCGANSLDRDGATPLQRLLEHNEVWGYGERVRQWQKLLKTMIVEGADTEALHSGSKEKLLIHALRHGKADMVKGLLLAGADRNVTSSETGESAEDIIRTLRVGSDVLNAIELARQKILEDCVDARNRRENLWLKLVGQGRDGVVRLTPFARTLPEREQLMAITSQMPQNDIGAYKWMSGLRILSNPDVPLYSLDTALLDRLAPLARPETEVLVAYARGHSAVPTLIA